MTTTRFFASDNAAAACGHGKKILIRKFEYRDHFTGRFGKHNRLGWKLFFYGVGAIRLNAIGIDDDVIVTDDRSQFIKDLRLRRASYCAAF